MKTILHKGSKEEADRRNKQYEELQKLGTAATKAINEAGLSKDTVINALEEDIKTSEEINSLFKRGTDPYPLIYNKLTYLLKGAQILIKDHYEQITAGDYGFIPIPQEMYEASTNSQNVTSIPNYTQTALLEILSVVRNVSISKIPELLKEKIYDINISPNIQGVKEVAGNNLASLQDWKWVTNDHGYYELLVPSLGYYFGGSRYDETYREKPLKQEDCSSSVAKWAGATTAFTTIDILNQTEAASEVLKPIGEDREPVNGDVFAFKGHCGLVAKYEDSEAPITVLSYTRNMPFYEGLIYQKYPQINEGKNVITSNWQDLSELKMLEPYYGLDNPVGNIDQPQVSGEIYYYEEI